MGCPSQCILGENLTFTVQARNGTGAPADATGNVSYDVYEDETATAILSGTMTKLASKTGFYSEQIACTTANGFERYKSYTIRITATVATISVAKTYSFICLGVEDTPSATSGALTSLANVKSYLGISGTDEDTLLSALITRATAAIEAYCDRTLRSASYRRRFSGDGSKTIILPDYPVTAITLLSLSVEDAVSITNTSSDAYSAYITVSSTTMTLTIVGGTDAGSDALTLADYTLTTLVAAIDALTKGWDATLESADWGVWAASEILPVDGLQCLDKNCYMELPDTPEDDFVICGQLESPYRSNYGKIYLDGNVFPTGEKNIVVKYTAGYGTTPADLEQICIDLVSTYRKDKKRDWSVQSERLGDHAISYGDMAKTLAGPIPMSIAERLSPYMRL